MRIVLRDREPYVTEAWRHHFRGAREVEIEMTDIFDGFFTNAIISPANSYGFMDGGIDAVYAKRWPELQGDLQAALRLSFSGHIPVGWSRVTMLHDAPQLGRDFDMVITCPTMRIPESIVGTSNVYLAFLAALQTIKSWNQQAVVDRARRIESVTCPGMGTGVGKMDPDVAAYQMRVAYDHWLKTPDFGPDMSRAIGLEYDLRMGGK